MDETWSRLLGGVSTGSKAEQAKDTMPDIPKGKKGRPKGFDGTRSKMPSALAISFKRNGLDWQKDFAEAIKRADEERIRLWLRLLPYMITTSRRVKVGKWKGRPSKAARIALEAMEQEL